MPRSGWVEVSDAEGRAVGRARESEARRRNPRGPGEGGRTRIAVLLVNHAGEIRVRPAPRAGEAAGVGEASGSGSLAACLDGLLDRGATPEAAARRLVEEAGEAAGADPVLLCAIDQEAAAERTRTWVFRCAVADTPAEGPVAEVPDPVAEVPGPAALPPDPAAWSSFLPLDSLAALLGRGHLHPTSGLVVRAIVARRERRMERRRGRRPAALCDAATYTCRHCGESNTVPVDPAGGGEQDLIEDCQVCCAPNRLCIVFAAESRVPSVTVDEV